MTGREDAPDGDTRPDALAVALDRWAEVLRDVVRQMDRGDRQSAAHDVGIIAGQLEYWHDKLAGARPTPEPGAVDAAARAVIGAAEPSDGFDPDSDLVVPAARMRALVAAAGPDDSRGPTTETRTEYRVTATDNAGHPAESVTSWNRDRITSYADQWRAAGWTDVRIEFRTVTTTVTPWTEVSQ